MTEMEKGYERRISKRMNLALSIFLPDQECKTINISSSGVYFEATTRDINAFSPGTAIPVRINAVTSTPGCGKREVKLKGIGSVVRSQIKDITGSRNRLVVAMKFNNKLDVIMN